jgi:hypothetical protein
MKILTAAAALAAIAAFTVTGLGHDHPARTAVNNQATCRAAGN